MQWPEKTAAHNDFLLWVETIRRKYEKINKNKFNAKSSIMKGWLMWRTLDIKNEKNLNLSNLEH